MEGLLHGYPDETVSLVLNKAQKGLGVEVDEVQKQLPHRSPVPVQLPGRTGARPARVRTALCSLTMPEYSTGMSQPP